MKCNNANVSVPRDGTRASGLQIVLIDDSSRLRDHVALSLSGVKGVAEIRQADNATSGLALLRERRADVLVLDIEMPGPSGLDLLPLVRGGGQVELIIMLSNHDYPKLRQKCSELGADFYFHKLHEFERVAEVCQDLATRRTQTSNLPCPFPDGETP